LSSRNGLHRRSVGAAVKDADGEQRDEQTTVSATA
jgi:hypothetical protein